MIAAGACIAYNKCMQYTIRKIPKSVDAALRRRARSEHQSLNEAAVAALARGLGADGALVKRRDLGDIAGSWTEDPAITEALAAQRQIDPDLWK